MGSSPFRRLATALFAGLLALGALGACRGPEHPPIDLNTARPADAALAARYERACKACHATPGSGAPLVGDRAAWAPREAGGTAPMLANVRSGMGTMPPMGWCPDCTDDDLRALIDFLRSGGRS